MRDHDTDTDTDTDRDDADDDHHHADHGVQHRHHHHADVDHAHGHHDHADVDHAHRHDDRADAGGHHLPDRPELLIDFDQFQAVDMRVGRIVTVDEFPEARVPAWKLTIDFGPEIGVKRSSAQITHYAREQLEGRLVIGVVNLTPRQVGPFRSEGLVLGALDEHKGVVLLQPDQDGALGSRIG